MYKVKIANIKEFQESRGTWNKLALSMNLPSIFCTWEWIYTWWEHFGRDYEPVILFVYKGAELVGILPLAYHKTSNVALIGRKLSYCGSMELYPDHLDIICLKEDAEQCLDAVFDFFTSEYKSWDVIDISLLSDGGNLLSYLKENNLFLDFQINQLSIAPYIASSGSFEDYINTFDSKKRYNLKKKQKRLSGLGVKYILSEGISQNHEHLRILFGLHKQRAEKKNIISSFQGKDIFEFHNTLIQRIDNNRWLWLRHLKNDKEIISSFYGFNFGNHLFYYQLGLNTAWEQYSPGTVLFYEVINEAFSKGCMEFDFLRGNEEYKSRWTRECRSLVALNIYNKNLRGSLSRTFSQSKALIKTNLKRLIGHIN